MSEQSTADILRKAKALISNPENWSQDGMGSVPCAGKPICLCAAQAVIHVGEWSAASESSIKYLHEATPDAPRFHNRYGNPAVGPYNDNPHTTHADIMDLFDRAIELAEAEA